MPTAALTRCRGRCGAFVSGGWCSTCKPDVKRFKQGATAYTGARWLRLRDSFRLEHPFCCEPTPNPRCTKLTDVVDHKRPHRGDEALMYDRSNLQPVCYSCHGIKTAREVGFAGHTGGASE